MGNGKTKLAIAILLLLIGAVSYTLGAFDGMLSVISTEDNTYDTCSGLISPVNSNVRFASPEEIENYVNSLPEYLKSEYLPFLKPENIVSNGKHYKLCIT